MKSIFNRSAHFYRNWFWVCLVLILTVSSIPRIPNPTLEFDSVDFEFRIDYFFHFLQYAILISLFMFWQIQQKRQITIGIIVFALLMGFLLGIADEVHQIFIPSRRFNPVDMTYNCIGVLTGVAFSYWYLNRVKKAVIEPSGK